MEKTPEKMNNLIFIATLILYFFSMAGFLAAFLSMRKGAEKVACLFLYAGFAAHTVCVAARWISDGHPPLVNMFETLSFFAWVLAGLFILLQYGYRLKSAGAFVMPLVVMIMTTSAMQSREVMPLPPVLKSAWLPVHATVCLVSYALMALAFAIAVMYLLQERQIRKRRFGLLFSRLPSLETLDRITEKCLKIGFPLLSLGIITGSIWADQAWGTYWSWDPKETWSLVVWFLYAALLHQRLTTGWRGRKAAWLTIAGFAAICFSFVGVTYLLPGAHSYATWFE
jgi:cytochrome c-type biogenesis protein CcsB